jgi:hypothetical protein
MGKHVRTVVLAILMLGLTALPAFAGTVTITPSGGISIAFEAAPSAAVSPRTLSEVTFNFTQNVDIANIIKVDLGSAKFVAATVYNLCSANTTVATFVPGAVSVANFQVTGATVAAGDPIQLTSDACGDGTAFTFTTGTNAGNSILTFTQIGVGGIVLDISTSGTFVTITNEYSATVGASTHFIDVLAGTGATFTIDTGTSPTGVLGAAPVVMADSRQGSHPANPSIAIAVATLTDPVSSFPGIGASATVTLVDSQKFQGVQKVFIAAGGTNCDSTATAPSAGNLVQSSGSIVGQSSVVLTLPSEANGGFDQTTPPTTGAGKLFRLCVLANGTDFLDPRTITANVDVNITCSPGLCQHSSDLPTGALNAQIWQLTGGDIRISGVRADAATNNNTLINLNNLGPTDGAIVLLQVFRTQTVTTQATPACTLDTAGVGVTLNGNGGHQITGQDINAACFTQVADLNSIVYAVRMVLGIAPGNLSTNAFRQFPDGRFLELPVLKLGNAFPND